MLRYCLSRYFFSRALSWAVVKGVRGLRLGLCLRRVHLSGPLGGRRDMSKKIKRFDFYNYFQYNVNNLIKITKENIFHTIRVPFHYCHIIMYDVISFNLYQT